MQVTFIDAEANSVSRISNFLSEHSKECSYIIHRIKPADLPVLKGVIEENPSLTCVPVNSHQSVCQGAAYLLSGEMEFTFDGVHISLKNSKLSAANSSAQDVPERLKLADRFPGGFTGLLDQNLKIVYTSSKGPVVGTEDHRALYGQPISDVLSTGAYELLAKSISRLSSCESVDFDLPHQDRIYQNSVSAVRDKNGKFRYYMLKVSDITEQKRIEIALRESEARHRYMIEMSRELVCTHAPDGTYKFVSPSALKVLGYSPAELAGRNPAAYIHPEDKLALRMLRQSSLTGGESKPPYRFRRKDGTYIWLDTYTEVIQDQKNQVSSLITVSRDITELKEAELRLRESEERFRAIADNVPGVVYLCRNDATYSMVFLNEEVERLTGFPQEDFLQNRVHIVDLFHPEDRDEIFRRVDLALEKKESFHLTYRISKKGSEAWTWVEEYGQGIYEDGELKLIEGVILDITERKLAESRLQEREANLKAIFESTNSLIGLFDSQKNLVEYNQAFADYVKATDGIDLYQGMELISKLNPGLQKTFNEYLDRGLQGEKFKVTIKYPTATGNLHFLSSHNPIYQNDTLTGLSLFVEDITELHEYQQKLERYTENLEQIVEERTQELKFKNQELVNSNSELEKALEDLKSAEAQLIQAEKMASLGMLAAGIGHEINNPLNFIKNGCAALFREIVEEPETDQEVLKEYFDIIDDGVNRASQIVKSLSHFSRQVKSMDEKCVVRNIIDNCLVILNSRLKGRIEVVKQYGSQELVVTGNEGKLHQAFLNILANAEQAIKDRGTITITTEQTANGVVICFKDDGEGIPEENLSKISDPFFTTKPPGSGTGLGLFITYSIIKEHRGDIQVTSAPQKGTEFVLAFPEAAVQIL